MMIQRRALRIAMMLESDGPGGAEMMVFRLCDELRNRGHAVVPVHRANGNGWLGTRLRGAGMSAEAFHIRWALDPRGVSGLVQVCRDHKIDIVHSHEFTMAVYGAAAARIARLPQVITMHGGFKACKVLRRRIALRWAMRSANCTVMVSRATRGQFARELGVSETEFEVVPNGVSAKTGDRSQVGAEFGIRPGECVLLAVGTLEEHKGHHILLEALVQLRAQGVNVPWKLIIAGGRGGDKHESLLSYVRDNDLGKAVHIVTNRDDVPDLLALADVFVIPSLWEGLPMALLEAMVAGKAIVASATAGIPEAIVDGRDGLLAPPGDVSKLAVALKCVLTDPSRRAALGNAAAARGQKEFTVEVMADHYEDIYWRALVDRRVPLTA